MTDQTNFSQTQEVFQAPPENPIPQAEKTEEEILIEQKKKAKIKFIAGLSVAGVVLFIMFILLISSFISPIINPASPVFPEATDVTLPVNPPRPPSEFRQKLDKIETQINQSDPSVVDLDPPPLNYEIEL